MNKNIDTITEELMMRYVEGSMDSEESAKFERILSKNEYLNNRVNILKTMVDNNPLESPSSEVHREILSGLNIPDRNNDVSSIKKYADAFMSLFEKRPALMGSILSGVAAVFIFFIFKGSDEVQNQTPEFYKSNDITYNDAINNDTRIPDKSDDEKAIESVITD